MVAGATAGRNFDTEAYAAKLIAKGTDPETAREIAEKTAKARANPSSAGETPAKRKRNGSTFQQPADLLSPILAKVEQRAAEARERKEQEEAEAPKQLPLWADWERAMPTPISRSALFAPIARGARKHHKDTVIDSRPDVVLTYTGEQLDMGDADVFMQALEMAKRYPLGTSFIVNRAEFLDAIGRTYESKNASSGAVRRKSIGSETYEWLDAAMTRLREGSLNFAFKQTPKRKPKGGILNLVKEWFWDSETNTYLLAIDPKVYNIFESFSRIYLEKHLALPKADQLAKWLHLYVAGCDKSVVTKIGLDHLRAYSGNKHRRMDHFSRSMERALQALQDAGVIAPGWFIRANGAMVHFTRIV